MSESCKEPCCTVEGEISLPSWRTRMLRKIIWWIGEMIAIFFDYPYHEEDHVEED